jgi:mannose-6-phosphate isomerase
VEAPSAEQQSSDVLTGAAEKFFRAQLVTVDGTIEYGPEYAVLVILGGEGSLEPGSGSSPVPVRRGSTVLVPYGAGSSRLTGHLSVLRCLPPAPPAASSAVGEAAQAAADAGV